jgi:hypothetical protein
MSDLSYPKVHYHALSTKIGPHPINWGGTKLKYGLGFKDTVSPDHYFSTSLNLFPLRSSFLLNIIESAIHRVLLLPLIEIINLIVLIYLSTSSS